jgi:hypothetical protein
MLGRSRSDETRRKIAEKARGRTVSSETKQKIVQTKLSRGTLPSGESHYRWKGGRSWRRFAEPEYIAWRNAVLERDGYQCNDCRTVRKKHEKGLAAHHLLAYATHPELRLEVSNGVTLCRHCHMARHSKNLAPAPRVPCACGCGTLIDAIDPYGRPRRYANFHGKKGLRKNSERTGLTRKEERSLSRYSPRMCACGCGGAIEVKTPTGRPPSYLPAHRPSGYKPTGRPIGRPRLGRGDARFYERSLL